MKDEITDFSELQLGNAVKCRKSNDAREYKIMALDGYNHKVMLNDVRKGEWLDLKQIRALPLDYTWYEDFEFIKTTHDDVATWERTIGQNDYSENFSIWITDPKAQIDMAVIYSLDDPDRNCQVLNVPKYVHQLQNLWKQISPEPLY